MGQIDNNDFIIKEDGTIVRNNKVNDFKKKIVANERITESKNEHSAGPVGLILSFLFPIIGFICFFLMQSRIKNPSAYLYSALGGFVFSIILIIISSIVL